MMDRRQTPIADAHTRRRFPRLDAHVVWRSAGLRVPQHTALNMSVGGMLVYSDELLKPGARLEVELLVPDEATIEVHARVVRVETLPAGSAALYDVALEFLDVPDDAKARLAKRLGITLPEAAVSEARVDEEQPEQVDDIEPESQCERLLQAPLSIRFPGSPDGDRDVCDQDRHQQELLHCGPLSEGRANLPRDAGKSLKPRLSVLFVTPYLPSPARFGGQQRLHGLISGLAALHDVSVLSLVDPSEDQTEGIRATGAYCRRVVTVPNDHLAAGPTTKRLLQLKSLLSSQSYESMIHRNHAFEIALEALLRRERFDIVHFEFPHMAAYRPDRPKGATSGPAFLLDEHNIEYDIVRQTARAEGSALRRAYSAINWKKIKTEERRAWGGLDGCTLTSARDQGMLLEDAPETRTAVVPNGVDLDFFQPRSPPAPREPTNLLFFGAIDYHPNTDGLLYFLNEVFPLLSSRAPRIKLSIVGRRPPEAITSRRSAEVEVTGAVDDLRPYLERAAIVIVPLRLGGGTRLKILEAMAMGKAVVSTSLGAEGLDVVPERDLLIADDAAGFAAQIKRLLDDPELAARLGAAARKVMEKGYGWGASVERLSAFYGAVLEARRTA